jgi:hypothetical protein
LVYTRLVILSCDVPRRPTPKANHLFSEVRDKNIPAKKKRTAKNCYNGKYQRSSRRPEAIGGRQGGRYYPAENYRPPGQFPKEVAAQDTFPKLNLNVNSLFGHF